MKKKPVKHTSWADEVDYNIPDYKTVIAISSKDQLNITLSKCGLAMLSNLGTVRKAAAIIIINRKLSKDGWIFIYNVHILIFLQAFAEAAKQTAECFQKDEAPFVVKNRLGLPVFVCHSEMFRPIGHQSINRTVELQDGETLGMDYSTTTESDQFSAMTSLSGKDYYIQPSKIRLIRTYNMLYAVYIYSKFQSEVVSNPEVKHIQYGLIFLCPLQLRWAIPQPV